MGKRVFVSLLALLGLAVLSWQAFSHVDFDGDPLNLMPPDLPQVGAMRAYDKAFASQNDVLITVTQPNLERGEEATKSLTEHLGARKDLFQSISGKPPWEEDPSQMGELLAYLWANGSPEALQDLQTQRLNADGVDAELAASLDVLENSMDMKEVTRVSHDPLNLSNFGETENQFQLEGATRFSFVSDDGELHLILAEPATALRGGSDVVAWREAVWQAVSDWRVAEPELADGTLVQLTGRKIYMTEMTIALRKDLMISVIITLGFVAVLFGVLYRRIMPLLLLLAALYVTFILTLLLGRLFYEELSAMAVGFAAILMGLAVDYGFVIYQEACCSGKDPRTLRRLFGRSIGWAALTTACVFLALNRSALPGAAQLGTMVAIGVVVGALMMIFPYASLLGRFACTSARKSSEKAPLLSSPRFGLWFSVSLVVFMTVVLSMRGLPPLNPDAEQLRPEKQHESMQLYKDVMESLGGGTRTVTMMASSSSDAEMLEIFDRANAALKSNESVDRIMLPSRLWPNRPNMEANRTAIAELVEREPAILAQAEAQDFTDEALVLAKGVFASWRRFLEQAESASTYPFEQEASRWLLDRLLVSSDDQRLAIGFARLDKEQRSLSLETVEALNEAGLRPIGWGYLAPELQIALEHDMRQVVLPTIVVMLVLLTLVFRSIKGVFISITLLGGSALVLMALMRLLGRDWNIVNVGAIPILLGLGLDYSIHVILALRRTHGNVAEIRANIGRALLLCGATTAVGFASLMSARHGGLPQLGQICAIGILITMITAIFLVPHWWRFLHQKELHDR